MFMFVLSMFQDFYLLFGYDKRCSLNVTCSGCQVYDTWCLFTCLFRACSKIFTYGFFVLGTKWIMYYCLGHQTHVRMFLYMFVLGIWQDMFLNMFVCSGYMTRDVHLHVCSGYMTRDFHLHIFFFRCVTQDVYLHAYSGHFPRFSLTTFCLGHQTYDVLHIFVLRYFQMFTCIRLL